MAEYTLHGSGGHVVAELTDAEAGKADLGVGKLFLAPVGKMGPEKMLGHFCKECAREFDGPPETRPEPTNEDVSENLVLVERGRYACRGCDGTIGEYRVFRKHDEGSGAGMAKPGG